MQFEKWVKVDIAKGHAREVDVGMILFTNDTDSLKIGAELYYGQYEYPVEGTVSGKAILPNGTTLTLTGYSEEDSNRGWVVIPQVTRQGKIEIFLRITDDTSSAVVLHARGYVKGGS